MTHRMASGGAPNAAAIAGKAMFTTESSETRNAPPTAIHRAMAAYDGTATMPDPSGWALLIAVALIGSTIAGAAGFGAGVVLLPALAWVMGVRAAVPILTVTMLLGNVSRVWWSRREIDSAVVWRYLIGAVPGTVLGVVLFAGTPSTRLSLIIGAFLIAAVPLRRLLGGSHFTVALGHFPWLGGAAGLLSSLVVAVGPVVTPFFLAYGLRRGAYIATEAACALAMHAVRSLAFARYALLTRDTVVLGVVLGTSMFAGAWAGRRLIDRLSDRAFLVAVEALLLLMGLHFLLLRG